MSDMGKIFELMGEVSGSIFPLGREVVMPLFEKHFTEQRFYGPTFMAVQVAPKSISVEFSVRRTPYTKPSAFEKILEDTAEADYLDEDGTGGYVVSEKGLQGIREAHTAFYAHLNKINQFPTEKMEELAGLLKRMVNAAAEVEFETGKTTFDISHGGHPKVEANSLSEVDQLLDDLRAFRDDAHIAAWKDTGVSGQLWEALTFIWRGDAKNAEELAEKLPFRGYTAEEYAKALGELRELGWVDVDEDGYRVTAAGQKVREEAEALTNSNYYLAMAGLSNADLKKLEELLTELKSTNEKLLPKEV